MIPPEPPRQLGIGFLFFTPYRVQGWTIAGEESFVQVPELDVCFDIGRAPGVSLTSNYVALTHGHMDHSAGIAYYFSQRVFQGMKPGTLLCHPALADPIRRLMAAWIDVEHQRTPHNIVAMAPGTPSGELEIKNHIFLRAFETNHRVPSLGFSVVEKRSKLKEEYAGLPQEKLIAIKKTGQEITYIKEVPLVAYMGDTAPGDFFRRPDVADANILIVECTFMEEGHDVKAESGYHMHLSDIVAVLEASTAPNVVLTHLSRRTHLGQAKQDLERAIPKQHRDRVHILMDHRVNRARYEKQVAEGQAEAGKVE